MGAPATAVKTYDLSRIKMIVGSNVITGFQDGDAIKVEYDADLYTKVVGADGEVARSATNNRTGKITIGLLYSAEANGAFQAFKKLDEDGNLGSTSLYVKDMAGGAEFYAAQAWVMKDPGATFGREMAAREWVFDCGQIDSVHGGITPPNLAT